MYCHLETEVALGECKIANAHIGQNRYRQVDLYLSNAPERMTGREEGTARSPLPDKRGRDWASAGLWVREERASGAKARACFLRSFAGVETPASLRLPPRSPKPGTGGNRKEE
jgi:hypothetical protein